MNKGSIGSSKFLTYLTDKLFSFSFFKSQFSTEVTEQVIETIDETVSGAELNAIRTLTGCYQNVTSLRLLGQKVGDTYHLGYLLTFDVNVVSNFGEARFDIANGFNFMEGKTIDIIAGSHGTNINSSTDGRNFMFGYADKFDANTLRLTLAGDDAVQAGRVMSGSLVMRVNE